MSKKVWLALILFACLLSPASVQTQSGKETRRQARFIVGYLPEYRIAEFPVKEIENRGAAKRLTHIIYGFVNITDGRPTLDDEQTAYKRAVSSSESVDGKADDVSSDKALRGAFNQLRKLKALHPQLHVRPSPSGQNQATLSALQVFSRHSGLVAYL